MNDQSTKSGKTQSSLRARRWLAGGLLPLFFATSAQNLYAQGTIAVGSGGAEAIVMPANGTVQGTLPPNTRYGLIGTTDTPLNLGGFSDNYKAGVLGLMNGTTVNTYGVFGSGGNAGVYGNGSNNGVQGSGFRGVVGQTFASTGSGIYGDGGGVGVGVLGTNAQDGGVFIGNSTGAQFLTGGGTSSFSLPPNTKVGIIANAGFPLDLSTFSNNQNIGLYAIAGNSGARTPSAAVFNGNVFVYGSLSKGGGSFKIDHPLDPENKYLSHSFVESPDMKNVYDGITVLDGSGQAVVELPDWFEALNSDYRYQLTAIGGPAPGLYIAQEVQQGRFVIAGGVAGQKVSWQVTGIRQDAWAKKNRIRVEEDKSEADRGSYLYPEAYGLGRERSLDRAVRSSAAAKP